MLPVASNAVEPSTLTRALDQDEELRSLIESQDRIAERLRAQIERDVLDKVHAMLQRYRAKPLTLEQAAEWLQISPREMLGLVKKGAVNAFRIGKHIRIHPQDLEELYHRFTVCAWSRESTP